MFSTHLLNRKNAQGGGLWTPANNPAMFWWKADAGVSATGSDVDSWTDQNTGLVLISSGTQRPKTGILSIEGINVLKADGVDDEMKSNLTGNISDFCYTIVCGNANVGGVYIELFENGSNTLRRILARDAIGTLGIVDTNNGLGVQRANIPYPNPTSHMIVQVKVASGVEISISVNNSAFVSNTTSLQNYPTDSIVLFDDSSKDNTITSHIGEVFFHQSTEFSEAYNYATSRWGEPN